MNCIESAERPRAVKSLQSAHRHAHDTCILKYYSCIFYLITSYSCIGIEIVCSRRKRT